MAAGIFIATYQLEIYQAGSNTPMPLTFAQGKTLYGEVKRILDGLCGGYTKDEKDQSLLRIRHADLAAGATEPTDGTRLRGDGTNLWGTCHRGEYGYAAPFVNVTTFANSMNRTEDDAELLPFYFRFHLPANENSGLLLLERVGAKSPYTQLKQAIQAQFRDSNPGFQLSISRIVPTSVIEALMKGDIRTFRIVTYGTSKDAADTFLRGTHAEIGTMEIVWRAPRKQSMWGGDQTPKFIADILNGKATIAKFFGEDAKSMRIGVDYNGRVRQFDVASHDAAPYLDVTDEVAIEKGHPTFSGLDQVCLDVVTELRQQLAMEGTQ
ncbi:hypothetical protein UFOVP998_62 [uncultured Caudovirales phage]|uniref:Uncharacterized protein n=1 Tax=uncultured Caudovirales phage TaxID=2100421 RepID=A0A6J5Q1Z2_9CAUD|nr:hypothetical protein UFOVP998_62 [uncultured Caudovirales phage]CAB4199546.1 hypothetical protein UFOVP1331_59 [uncultured Caudovirales phage]CAB4212641.1 hypothetical protein UFOVP1442_16 [uncultured Caudovirales phage]CAB5228057.1 hypothetical protein UFOVP1535_35 [uncultured Caudovirales phage]